MLEGLGIMFALIGVAFLFHGFPDINMGNTIINNYYDSDEDEEDED